MVQQRRLKVSSAVETGLLLKLVDAPIEALDHAGRLRRAAAPLDARCRLDARPGTGNVELVYAARLLVLVGK
jgi:hypothetical protein